MNDLDKNRKIFFIGIGGVGMSAIAVILHKRGYKVSGSDRSESSTIKDLIQLGIEVKIGHDADNIKDDVGSVVYTNAISPDNPEYVKAKKTGLKIYERAKMLDMVAGSKFAIGVSGTHGKTTTTSMVSKIFLNAGYDPSLAVGGFLKEINGSGYEGKGKYFIYEACEAFSSFLKLHPDIAIITNIDDDHLDYYKSMSNIKKAFKKYISSNIPPYGILIYNRDDANLRGVVDRVNPVRVISVGINENADYTAEAIRLDDFSSSFIVKKGKELIGKFIINIPGMHNVYNGLLAIAASLANGISIQDIYNTLANFKNADRRFQLKLNMSNLIVIDDYAHHPSEIDATLKAAKQLSLRKNAQLIAVFQPHLYSRTQLLYKDFAKSLSKADRIVLMEIYAARETNDNNISSKMIYDEIVKIKGEENVIYSKDFKDVPEKVKLLMNGNNIVITLGAGDVWKVSEMFTGSH